MREQLARGETIEVGGYAISPGLGLGMEATKLSLPMTPLRIVWLEVSGAEGAELSPAARRQVEALLVAGHRVDARVVQGLPFWQTQEIAECPALTQATLDAVQSWRR